MEKFNKYNRIGADYFERKDKINFGKRMSVEQYGMLRLNKKH